MNSTSIAAKSSSSAHKISHSPLLLANLTATAGGYAFIALAAPMSRLLHLQAWQIGLIIAVVGLAWVLASNPWGQAVDRLGRIAVIKLALLGFGLGYLGLAAYVGWALTYPTSVSVRLSITLVLVARVVMGIFFASLPVAATAYIADTTSQDKRAAAIAQYGAAGALGMIIAPPLAGLLARENLAGAFMVFALFSFVGLPWLRKLPETRLQHHELKGKVAPLDKRIRFFWFSSFSLYSAVMVANSCIGFYIIDHFQIATQNAAAVTGLVLGSAALALVATQITVSKLPHVPALRWLRWGSLIAALGFGSVLLLDVGYVYILCLCYFIAAIGMGAAIPASSALATTKVDAHEQAACAGAMSTALGLSMMLAPLIGMALYDWRNPAPFGLIALMLAAVWLASLAYPNNRGCPSSDLRKIVPARRAAADNTVVRQSDDNDAKGCASHTANTTG